MIRSGAPNARPPSPDQGAHAGHFGTCGGAHRRHHHGPGAEHRGGHPLHGHFVKGRIAVPAFQAMLIQEVLGGQVANRRVVLMQGGDEDAFLRVRALATFLDEIVNLPFERFECDLGVN